jgi:hypothetical protein
MTFLNSLLRSRMTTKYFLSVLTGVLTAFSLQGASVLLEPHISTPSGQYTTNQITVEGTAVGGSAITSIQYLFNGAGPFTATQPNTNNWNKWQAAVMLNAGSNVFQVWAVGTNGVSHTNTARYFLIVKTPITVTIVGSGHVVPNYNGKDLIVDHSYTMVALRSPGQVFAGWSGTVASDHSALTFQMQEGENLTATFVPSPFTNGLTGVYDGLFYPSSNPSETNSGYLTLTLGGDNGMFSGSLTLDGQTKFFASQFDGAGAAQFTVARPVRGNLVVSLSLDLSGVNGVTGTIVCTNSTNAFSATVQAYKIVSENANYEGYYTWYMNGSALGAAGPEGYSYGTVAVPKKGNAIVDVNLSDGSTTVVSHGLTAGGLLPLYISLNGGHGSLSGWLAFKTNDLTDNLMDWFKNPTALGSDTNGRALIGLSLRLCPYEKGTNTLGTNNVVVQFAGDDLTNTITDLATLDTPAGTNTVTDPNHVAVSLDLKTGLFTGTFLHPLSGKKLPIHGVLVQAAQGAFGYFMPADKTSGTVTFYAP